MENAYIFVDETGKADLSDQSQFFCLSAIVINDRNREKLKVGLESIKLKYFGAKSYVIHGSQLKRDLRVRKKDQVKFAHDVSKLVMPIGFFALCTITDKKKAYRSGWFKSTILQKSYRMILSNLIKFVIAKNYRGQIIVESSAHEQDLHLYKNFFHFMGNGIERLNITSSDVKKHVTAISYVTKQNEDCETQLVDLLAGTIEIKHKLDRKLVRMEDLGEYDKEMLNILKHKLFVTNVGVTNLRKKELYSSITAYKRFP